MNQYVKQYQKTTVETASNEKILIMLYDGAIQFLNKAKIALGEKNWEQSHNNLMGAQRILEEFINTIDKEPNPELAQNLINLYEYFITRLVQANMKHQIEPVDEVRAKSNMGAGNSNFAKRKSRVNCKNKVT